MSTEARYQELLKYLTGKQIASMDFYSVDQEELIPIGESNLVTDGGVMLHFTDGSHFTFGYDGKLELNNFWMGLPDKESGVDAGAISENKAPDFLESPIEDVGVIWETLDGVINPGEDFVTPIILEILLENGVRFGLAAVVVDETKDDIEIALDIEGNVMLVLEEDLLDFLLDEEEEIEEGLN